MIKKFLLLLIILSKINSAAESIIIDQEINDYLDIILGPIIDNSGYKRKQINLYIIDKNEIGAFATNGRNIFINSGIIKQYKDVNVLAGIFAHELAHVKSGHIVMIKEDEKEISKSLLAGALLTAAGAVSGNDSITKGGILGSFIPQKQMLARIRSYEMQADKIGVKLLEKSGYDINGINLVLKDLSSKETSQNYDQSLSTHPSSNSRRFSNKINSEGSSKEINPAYVESYRKLRLKLMAFTERIEILNKRFTGNDQDSLYVKSIVNYRMNKNKDALDNINQLININNNIYYQEQKAAILTNMARIQEANSIYQELSKKHNSDIYKLLLSVSYINLSKKNKNQELAKKADNIIDNLLLKKPEDPDLLYYSSLASSLHGNIKKAKEQTARLKKIKENT